MPVITCRDFSAKFHFGEFHSSPCNSREGLRNQLREYQRIEFYLGAARAPATHRAYAADIAAFVEWGGTIPATADHIAAYLATSDELAVSTLRRRLAALADAHQAGGHPDPTKALLVRKVFRGICRTRGVLQTAPVPLDISALITLIEAVPEDLLGKRDRALLLVGFFCALRRSELVGLRVEDLSQSAAGWIVKIRHSKTDQNGTGQLVDLPILSAPLCPATAVKAWLTAAGITTGLIFRQIDRTGKLSAKPMKATTVGTVLRHRATAAGLASTGLSAHSLRSGFAVSAVRAGVSLPMIQAVTRHSTLAGLEPYIRTVGPPPAVQMTGLTVAAVAAAFACCKALSGDTNRAGWQREEEDADSHHRNRRGQRCRTEEMAHRDRPHDRAR